MTNELKHCPFCGGKKKHDDNCYIALLAERVSFWSTDERELTEAWNTRYERTCTMIEAKGLFEWRCSECNEYNDLPTIPNFCPECGAKVVGE